jgi:hypothetical protein
MGNYSEKVMSKMPMEMKRARFNLEINRIFREKKIKEVYKMGYRSTVAYTIRFTAESNGVDSPTDEEVKKCKASFYTFLAEAKVKYGGAFSEEFGVVVDEFNFALNFLAEDVKWYEDYEDVKTHEALVQLSKDWVDMENKYIGGIFMRIGEEMDDLVEESWGEHDWDWMQMSRQIVVDWA